jgi:hypothetical protein
MTLPNYCTNTEVKAAMPGNSYGTTVDTLLTNVLCPHASRLIDAHVKKKPGAFAVSVDVVRYFDGSGTQTLYVGELAAAPTKVEVSLTGLITDTSYDLWEATDYVLYPLNAADEGKPYRWLMIDLLSGTSKAVWYPYHKAVKITGKFGYSTTPPDLINQAAIIQCVRWLKRGENAFADTGAIVELGQLTHTKKLDPEVELILSHFMPSIL